MPLEGLDELSKKLATLGKAAGKTLRSATLKATTPVVRKMRNKIPVGSKPHRTYKGRLVAPGFAKRSIRRSSSFRRGVASVRIGVRKEALYAVNFIDQGIHVTKRRKKTIKSYRIPASNWFKAVFIANKKNMEDDLTVKLKAAIEKVRRG